MLRLAMQALTKADDKTREKEMERKAASCCVWMISAGGGSTSGWGTCSVVRINMTVVIGLRSSDARGSVECLLGT